MMCMQVHIIDGCVTAEQAGTLSMELLHNNPLMYNAAVAIQARTRRLLARKRVAEERGLENTSELPGKSLAVVESSDDY